MRFRDIKSYFLHKFELIKVFGFVGSSGSGKSYNALRLVKKYYIDIVIDDGILIKNGKIIAGQSSKEEKTEMLAVRRAIFQDPVHALAVREVLSHEYYPRILALGTSKKMIDRICDNLFLPRASKIIRIEDVVSQEDIEYSHKVRNEESKHIIPLPYFEIRRYLQAKENKDVSVNDNILEEKTQVSPQFGRKGEGFSNKQLRAIIDQMLFEHFPGFRVSYISANEIDEKVYIDISIRNFLDSNKTPDKTMMKWELNDYLAKISKSLTIDKIL